jgi:hypothetical protein
MPHLEGFLIIDLIPPWIEKSSEIIKKNRNQQYTSKLNFSNQIQSLPSVSHSDLDAPQEILLG